MEFLANVLVAVTAIKLAIAAINWLFTGSKDFHSEE
jgi:hypothetical protein